ncbi:MAG: DUF2071 domain-containing protein [Acidobacteria bacterium]|nr:DUF2071 domain-containing protein [Acidobacteriota bacterium]
MIQFPIMYQRWGDITFLHWSCEPNPIQSRLPPRLDVDTVDGKGWIGLTPFYLSNLRPPFLPALPWLSAFPETNLRTYVRGPAGPGIWFFSLDAALLPAVGGARLGFGLPYYWSDMQVTKQDDVIHYYCNRGGRAGTNIRIRIGASIPQPGALAEFLTARFRLYAIRRGELVTAEVEHPAWPLHEASIIELSETLRTAAGVSFGMMHPMVLFSPGVDTRIGRLRLTAR